MMMTTRRIGWWTAVCAGLLVGLTPRGAARASQDAASDDARYIAGLPDRPEKARTVRLCTACHSMQMAGIAAHTRIAWQVVMDDMTSRGMSVDPADYDAVVGYLVLALPARVDVNHATSSELMNEIRLSAEDADRIVTYRAAHGAFRRWQDVENVPNVDTAKIEASREFLVAEP
jgi:hypothetical protein